MTIALTAAIGSTRRVFLGDQLAHQRVVLLALRVDIGGAGNDGEIVSPPC